MASPEAAVLKTDGTNCDPETWHALELAGARAEIVHVNQLRAGEKRLSDYGLLVLPGGFSYGDDIASGKVLANELASYLADEMQTFVSRDKPILGICNGFQVLVRTGLLPYGQLGSQQVTLTHNTSGRFECRWVELEIGRSVCRFVSPDDFADSPIPMQSAHGEGRLFGQADQIQQLIDNQQVVFYYNDAAGRRPEGNFPDNPNGSEGDIAGICDQGGTILGLMPHPERSLEAFHPDRSRTASACGAAGVIFSNLVRYAREI